MNNKIIFIYVTNTNFINNDLNKCLHFERVDELKIPKHSVKKEI